MKDCIDLNYDDDRPPWEDEPKPVPADASVCKETEDLEIYRKAENFKKLTLVSGGRLDCPLDKYVGERYGKEGLVRLKLARFVMKSLNLIPSDDVLLLLSSTKKAISVVATAGAGKTTSLQLYLLVSKMYDKVTHAYHLDPMPVEGTTTLLPSILYLNYNKHNVEPINERHTSVVSSINRHIEEKLDDYIESTTVHAFCHKWLGAFSSVVSLPDIKIASDADRQTIWQSIITPRWSKYYAEECWLDWQVMHDLYNTKVESMVDWDTFFESAKFVDTGLPEKLVRDCIKKYDSMKKAMKLMDFTDYLTLVIDTLKTNPELKERVQDRYKIIVADENQDFTALMNELLLQLYNPEKNRLIVVGDPDQTIYAFKGVSPDNIVGLVNRLDDVEVLGLDTNYRCPDTIVDAAKRILDLNVLRFDKPIKTVKTGGVVVSHPLSDMSTQYKTMLDIIKQRGEHAYGNTVVTYRNNKSAMILGEELYYANIPFKVLDSNRPFNNFVFKHIFDAVLCLQLKDDIELTKGLYRFMPISREHWNTIVTENSKRRRNHLHDLILPRNLPMGTEEAFNILLEISNRVDSQPVSDYTAILVTLYEKYYFNFIAKNPNPSIGDEDYYQLLLKRTLKFWSRPLTFDHICKEMQERNAERVDSVTLSTFHGLKGLEFDYVIAVDFTDSLFPNFMGIDQRYSRNTAMEEKESENRLCYVLVTRAIKELHLVYNASNPSYYVDILLPNKDNKPEPVAPIALGDISIPSDSASAKMSFIQKLVNRKN